MKDLENQTDWKVLLTLLPRKWKELARECRSVVYKSKSTGGAEGLLRILLLHIAQGYSLRETSARVKVSGIGNISDVGILKALRRSESWLQRLCQELYEQEVLPAPEKVSGLRMRLLDATTVQEPGATGSTWRLHYSMTLPELTCDSVEVTSCKGQGVAEDFRRFKVEQGDCLIADRGYSRASGVKHIKDNKGDCIVRVNTVSMKFYEDEETPLDLLEMLKSIGGANQMASRNVLIQTEEQEFIQGRVCVMQKSERARLASIKKLKRRASKNGNTLRKKTLVYAGYVIIFTTLSEEKLSVNEVLEWYRVRWQIELVFKRMKSLVQLGHLPKYDERSSRAWIYGKLLVSLLITKLARYAESFSPWGGCEEPAKLLERV